MLMSDAALLKTGDAIVYINGDERQPGVVTSQVYTHPDKTYDWLFGPGMVWVHECFIKLDGEKKEFSVNIEDIERLKR